MRSTSLERLMVSCLIAATLVVGWAMLAEIAVA